MSSLESNPHSFDSPHQSTSPGTSQPNHAALPRLWHWYPEQCWTRSSPSMPGMKVISNCLHFSCSFWIFYSPVGEENILVFKHFYCSIIEKNLVNEIKEFFEGKENVNAIRWQFRHPFRKFIEGKLSTRYFLGSEHTAVNRTEETLL